MFNGRQISAKLVHDVPQRNCGPDRDFFFSGGEIELFIGEEAIK